jgi:DNA-binding IclR family transcriptional regulator
MKSPAVIRAASVLDEVARGSGKPVSTSQLARQLDVPKSSIVNLCQALVYTNLLRRHESGYTLGWNLAELGFIYMRSLDPVQEFYDYWQERSEPFEYTVQLATLLDGMNMMFVARRSGYSSVQLVATVGRKMPANCTAAGKALLAGLDHSEFEQRLAQVDQLAVMTPRSLESKDALREEVSNIRARGFATNDEETMPGVLCVGANLAGMPGRTPPEALPADFDGVALSMTVVKSQDGGRRDSISWGDDLQKLLVDLGPRLVPGRQIIDITER